MRVGFYAPYDFGEATSLACSLADLARAMGMTVSYLAYNKREPHVRDYWDRRVRSAKRVAFRDWVREQDTIVWFDCFPGLLNQAQMVQRTNVLVPLWRTIDARAGAWLPAFDHIVAPSRLLYELFTLRLNLHNVTLAGWYAGPAPYTPDPNPVEEDKLKLYIDLDGMSCRAIGSALLSALHVALDRRPHLEVTLALGRRWSKEALPALQMVCQATGRLAITRGEPYGKKMQRYAAHDCVCCPNVCPNTGYDAIEALVHGCPVLAFDIPPYNEFLQPAHNGALLVCEPEPNWLGVPVVRPGASQLLSLIDGVAGNPRTVEILKRRSWPELRQRSQAFMRVWREIWDC